MTLFYQLAFVPDGKADIGPRQRMTTHSLDAMGQLGGIGFEELATRRRTKKQFLHFHCGAGTACHWLELPGASIQRIGAGLTGDPGQESAVSN
jgi:hypothetical protein